MDPEDENLPKVASTPTEWNGVRDKAVELRVQGRSPSYIAATLGVKKETVDRILRQEIVARIGNREQLIETTAMEIRWLKGKLIEKYQQHGDRKDAELALRYLERECRLFGLDAPVKHDVTISEMSDEDLSRELQRNSIATTLVKALPEPVEEAEYEEKLGTDVDGSLPTSSAPPEPQ